MGWQKEFMRTPSARIARQLALHALSQDTERGDATSERCIPASLCAAGGIVAKSDFILCGVVEAGAIFKSRRVRCEWKFWEGQHVRAGREVCRVSGSARDILACERTALDYLSLLSGIATACAKASGKHGKSRIAATRKTIPLLSHSQKRAVKLGGCLTHRLGLSDGILVKDNHVAALMNGGKVARKEAVRRAVCSFPRNSFVEVEVSSAADAVAAADAGADAILADNVPPARLREIARAARRINRRIIIEASGGITLDCAGRYLRAGATFVSTSELTMRVLPADLSLEMDWA